AGPAGPPHSPPTPSYGRCESRDTRARRSWLALSNAPAVTADPGTPRRAWGRAAGAVPAPRRDWRILNRWRLNTSAAGSVGMLSPTRQRVGQPRLDVRVGEARIAIELRQGSDRCRSRPSCRAHDSATTASGLG